MSDQIRQCDAGHLSLGAGNWECPWCKVAKAEAEVSRLRGALETAREYVPRQAVVTLELCDAALRRKGEKP